MLFRSRILEALKIVKLVCVVRENDGCERCISPNIFQKMPDWTVTSLTFNLAADNGMQELTLKVIAILGFSYRYESALILSIMLNLTSKQLRHAADLKEKIDGLETELATIFGGNGSRMPSPFKSAKTAKKKGMSAAGRARIAAAQKARWAKVKAAKPANAGVKTTAKRKVMSAAQKAKISAAAKKRWAKAKAAGKNSL